MSDILQPLAEDLMPMVSITVTSQHEWMWREAGTSAARDLFRYPQARAVRDPGRLCYLKFMLELLDEKQKLKTIAIDAFNEEWAKLVPGWTPPESQVIAREASQVKAAP